MQIITVSQGCDPCLVADDPCGNVAVTASSQELSYSGKGQSFIEITSVNETLQFRPKIVSFLFLQEYANAQFILPACALNPATLERYPVKEIPIGDNGVVKIKPNEKMIISFM
jgi:hypothetical protein